MSCEKRKWLKVVKSLVDEIISEKVGERIFKSQNPLDCQKIQDEAFGKLFIIPQREVTNERKLS